MMTASNQEIVERAERLYEQYGKPLEQEHWGEYVAIFPDGRFVIAHDQLEALDQALSRFGQGCFLFKVGEKVVGKWR